MRPSALCTARTIPRSAPPACSGRRWERTAKRARALARPLARAREKTSAAQRDGSVAAVAVDPGVRSALLAQEAAVQEMLGEDVAHRGEDGGAHAGVIALQVGEELLDALALQVLLRAAEVAGDERKLHLRGEG